MSRVTALLGKRNKASSGDGSKGRDDGNASSVTSTPEKDTKAPNSSRRDRAPSFADHDPPVTGNGNRTSVIRRQPSSGSITMHSTTADGTPIVYGTTTDENQSRPGKLGVDESASNGKLRRGTFSRGGPALDIPRYHSSNSATDQAADHEMSTTQYARVPSAFQPVGEGSLSLETLLRSNNQEAVTPKAGHLPFGTSISTSNLHPELFVTEASPLPSPVPGSEPAGARRASASGSIQYPPVFETSDLGSSSSSSTASRSENPVSTHQDTSQTADVPPIQLHPSEDYRVRSMSSGSMGQSLALPQGHEYSNLPTPRGRSSTEASTGQRSSFSRSPSRSSSFPLKANKSSKKANNGIASALALSGVALASPAPGVAHPFHMNRMPSGSVSSGQRTTPIKKETLSSDSLSVNGYRQASTESTSRTDERSNPERNSTEDADGFESPTPLSHYTPNDSPRYEDDPAFHAMVSIDALGEFDDLVNHMGTGYALASSKRNAEFHALFKHVPDEDYLIEDYGCALQREILIQGRLYISEHRLSFYANIFGWLSLNFHEIIAIEKRNTALVIPNAIHIATMHSRHTFASFISRDMAYDLIVSLWRNSHPVVPTSAALPDSAGIAEDDDEEFALSNADDHTGNEAETGRKKRRMRKGRFKRTKGGNAANGAGGDAETQAVGEGELDLPSGGKGRPSLGAGSLVKSPTAIAHAPTRCNCVASGSGHFSNVVMDTTFPGSPEKLYNLMFTSGFMKDFLTKDMKLTDLTIGDWAPQKNGSHLLTRTYSYIKPINAPVGPKSTKCILIDENLHVDFDDFVVNLTTTKTPEVPSGGSFAVKTKTCFMWARNNTTRVLVTTAVEWTGRSFIKSIVDKSSLDGQKTLYVALDSSIRSYISAHKSEFYDGAEGDDEEAHQSVDDDLDTHDDPSSSAGADSIDGKVKPKEPLAFISDTVPMSKPLCDFVSTLWDTLADVVGQTSPSTLICSFIIFVLFVSNIFTLTSLRHSSSRYVPQRRPPPEYNPNLPLAEEAEGHDVVAAAVRGVLHEYFQHSHKPLHTKLADDLEQRDLPGNEEAQEILTMIELLEKRVQALKSSLQDLD